MVFLFKAKKDIIESMHLHSIVNSDETMNVVVVVELLLLLICKCSNQNFRQIMTTCQAYPFIHSSALNLLLTCFKINSFKFKRTKKFLKNVFQIKIHGTGASILTPNRVIKIVGLGAPLLYICTRLEYVKKILNLRVCHSKKRLRTSCFRVTRHFHEKFQQ